MDCEQFEHIKNYCDSFDNPTALLCGDLICKYCNKENFLKKDAMLGSYLLENISSPPKTQVNALTMINGAYYSCRITPMWDEWLFCEFFSAQDIMGIAGHSDIHNYFSTALSMVQQNMSMLWKNTLKLENHYHEKGMAEELEKVFGFKKSITVLRSTVLGVAAYMDMFNPKNEPHKVDFYAILKAVIDRCNSRLAGINRCINLVSDNIGAFIYSTDQFVISAVVSMLQNALLYSTKDCVPVVSVHREKNLEKSFVIIRVVNDIALFVNEKAGETIGMNFCSQRLGLGIPTLKRFAEISNGRFSMIKKAGKVCVDIKIPEYIPPRTTTLTFESSGYSFYDCGIPDYIDSMLTDVIEVIKGT